MGKIDHSNSGNIKDLDARLPNVVLLPVSQNFEINAKIFTMPILIRKKKGKQHIFPFY